MQNTKRPAQWSRDKTRSTDPLPQPETDTSKKNGREAQYATRNQHKNQAVKHKETLKKHRVAMTGDRYNPVWSRRSLGK